MTDYFYRMVFRIRHPTIDPGVITTTLAMEPHRSWKVGESRTAPNGRALDGHRDDSFWSYREDYTNAAKAFFKEVDILVSRLKPHAAFLHELSAAGGKCEIYIQLPGSMNFGDSLHQSTLRSLADLGILLSLEVFPHWSDDT
jgi:hypothetical protein